LNFKTLKVAKTEFKPTIALKNKNEVNMGLIVSATSGELQLQFKPETLEIHVKSWVLKTKSSHTLSTQTNKLKH
jgi:hypothetical protein